jgi:integrase
MRWYVVIDDRKRADGRRRQRWHGGFPTRLDAEAARAEIVRARSAPRAAEGGSITLEHWIRHLWLPTTQRRIKPSTFSSYQSNLENHVLPALGHRSLQELTTEHLDGLYARLGVDERKRGSGPLSAKTIHYIHATIHKALDDAVDRGLLSRNPASRATPPRAERREMTVWGPAQLARFLEHAQGTELGAVWRLAAMTGMRRGELLGLRWGDVDLIASRVSVRRSAVVSGTEVIESTPKNHRARVIDLDRETAQRLRGYRLKQEAVGRREDHDAVAVHTDGTPIHPDHLSLSFQKLARAAGLPRIRLHDLRHTHATIALKAGISAHIIAERLGHASPAFTLDQYAHVLPGMQAEAAAQIAELVSSRRLARG